MKRIVVFAAAAAVASCTTVRTSYDVASGKEVHEINCAGPAPMSWKNCQAKADSVCPDGYDILSTSRDSTARVSVGGERRMSVRCR